VISNGLYPRHMTFLIKAHFMAINAVKFFGKTERLGFNPLSEDDIQARYYENFFDSEQNRLSGHSKVPANEESSRELLADCRRGNSYRFSVTKLDSGIKIGVCSIQGIDYLNKKAEIARFLWDKDSVGLGFGTEILTYLIQFSFNKINLNKISMSSVSSNIAAKKSCLKVGFKLEGILREQFYTDGKYLDVNYFGLLKDEYGKNFKK
jgi:RimJ/RimL family protein N-acetyltransferase